MIVVVIFRCLTLLCILINVINVILAQEVTLFCGNEVDFHYCNGDIIHT